MANMSDFAPPKTGFRDPRDTKQKNGMFNNPPRALFFGGTGSKGDATLPSSRPGNNARGSSLNAVGPISDRGKGGRR